VTAFFYARPLRLNPLLKVGRQFLPEGLIDWQICVDDGHWNIPQNKRVTTMRRLIKSALLFSLLASPLVSGVVASEFPSAEASDSARVQLRNVELTASGALQGQYLSEAGLPVAESEIVVTTQQSEQTVLTDAAGKFSVEGLQGGRAIIRAEQEVFACQLWTQGTAPPKSIKSIALVNSNGEVLRGNYGVSQSFPGGVSGGGGFRQFLPGRLAALSGRQLLALGLIAGGTIAIAEGANDDDAS